MKIKQHSFLVEAGIGAILLYLLLPGCTPPTEPEHKPNVIFLLIDDQRNTSLGCAGHPIIKTPVIDDLAGNGVRFSNAFVTTSICAASRASIFTGMHERTHQFTFNTKPLSQRYLQTSYPVLLREAGYHTGFIGKFGVEVEGYQPHELFDNFRALGRWMYFKKQQDGSERHITELMGDYAGDFLKNVPDGEPFCLSLSFNASHAEDADKENHFPWPKAVDGMYDDVNIPEPRLSDPAIFEGQPDFLKNSMNRDRYYWRWDTPDKYQKNMRAYFRMISGIDRVIGRIRAELKRNGQDENTVIIYMGDNGYYMGDRG
ncbi:MAG: sulfatase-like hydrolase/transferase, partial [Bacteroidales bacterium]|nr:sulfatase-like hydrolase/transferase [Bacteroidales bacterium]